MKIFQNATLTQQSLLILALFIDLIFSLFLLMTEFYHKKRRVYLCIDIGIFIFIFIILDILVHVFSQKYEYNILAFTPLIYLWVLWGIACMVFFYLVYEVIKRYCTRNEYLSYNCIKQAMDMLPCAVSYFDSHGDIKLCNLQMHSLFYQLAQKELQNLEDLKQALAECNAKKDVVELSNVRHTYLFPDEKVWRYSQSRVNVHGSIYTEVLFTDVTELYKKNLELKMQTIQLKNISNELKQLSKNADTLAKERENLIAKSKLHDLMGSGLLAIRQILRQKSSSTENVAAVMQFRQAVSILQEQNIRLQYDFHDFIQDAKVSGVNVELTGNMPEDKSFLRIVIPLLRETCVNAVRHADATILYIVIEQMYGNTILHISNNGNIPAKEIVPKGGLADIQKSVIQAGGEMSIQSYPVFILTVTLPLAKNKK